MNIELTNFDISEVERLRKASDDALSGFSSSATLEAAERALEQAQLNELYYYRALYGAAKHDVRLSKTRKVGVQP
jgi:hypothetical protein